MIRFMQALAIVAMCLVLSRPATADLTASPIPGDPMMVISMPQLDKTFTAFSKTPTYKALEELFAMPEIKEEAEFLEMMESLEEARMELGFPVTVESMVNIVSGVDFVFYKPESVDQMEDNPPIALLLNIKDAAKFDKILTTLQDKAREEEPSLQITKKTIAGKTITVVKPPFENEIAYGMVSDKTFILAPPEQVQRYVAGVAGGATGASFTKAAGPWATQANDMFMYINYSSFLEMMGSADPSAKVMMDQLLKDLGGLQISMVGQVAADRVTIKGKIPLEPMRGAKAYEMIQKYPPKTLIAANYVGQECLAGGWANTLDGVYLWEQMESGYQSQMAAMGMPAGSSLEDELKQVDMVAGFSIKDDLLFGVGPEAFLNLSRIQNQLVDVIIGLQVKDAGKIQKVIEGLENLINTQVAMMMGGGGGGAQKMIANVEYKGVTIKQLTIPALAWTPYSPCFASDGKFFMIAATMNSMRKSIDGGQGGQTVYNNEAFQPLLKEYDRKTNGTSVIDIAGLTDAIMLAIQTNAPMDPDEQKMADALAKVFKSLGVAGSNQVAGRDTSEFEVLMLLQEAQ